jgi:hypothetical protein
MKRGRRRYIERFLRLFMEELRVILRRRAPEMRRRFPDAHPACATCAFNPATDRMRGWDTTAHRLIQAIQNDEPFYCHHSMPYVKNVGWIPPYTLGANGPEVDVSKMQLCAGWADVVGDPDTKTAVDRAAQRLGKAPDEGTALTVRGEGCR